MKNLILAVIVFFAPAFVAAEDAGQNERVMHYVADEPLTVADSLRVLQTRHSAIAAFFWQDVLKDSELETVHEVSYSLEAAVDKLRDLDDGAHEDLIDALDEAVQAIHYASEEHDEKLTRKWFASLTTAIEGVNDAF